MTETTCGVSIPSSQSNQKRGSVGKLMPNMSAKLVGGELLVKGPNITKGYLNNPKKTAELFTADGWMKTGDLCEFDEEGYLFVIGRREDVSSFRICHYNFAADISIADLLQGAQGKLFALGERELIYDVGIV